MLEDTLTQIHMLCNEPKGLNLKYDRIVFQNGTLDISQDSKGFMKDQFFQEDRATILKHYAFDPTAQCPRFLQFLDEVELDATTQMVVQEWAGLLLLPETRIQKCLMLVGDGANGKSVLLLILREMLGADNVSSLEISELFDRFKLYRLENKLANISTDVSTQVTIDERFRLQLRK